MSKVTQELINKAKAINPNVFVLEVEANGQNSLSETIENANEPTTAIPVAEGDFVAEKGKFYAVIHKPNKRVIGLSMTYKDPIQMGNAILRNSIVEVDGEYYADAEILEDDDVNITAALTATEFVNLGVGKLKKY